LVDHVSAEKKKRTGKRLLGGGEIKTPAAKKTIPTLDGLKGVKVGKRVGTLRETIAKERKEQDCRVGVGSGGR